MTSASRIEPPGWMMRRDAGVDRLELGPSANGKNASEASTEAVAALQPTRGSSRSSPSRRGSSGRRRCRASPRPAPATIALDFTCRQTAHANSRSRHSASVGSRAVTTSSCGAVDDDDVAVLDEHAAVDLADVELARCARARRSSSSRIRTFGFSVSSAERVLVVAGRDQDLDELLRRAPRRARMSTVRLRAMMPPKALTGSPANALRYASSPSSPRPRAARVVVLDDHARRPLVADLGEHRAGAVEVEDVVERQLLAVQLAHAREHAAARADLRVEGRPLVRVLAVRQVDRLLVGAHVEVGEVVAALGEPARDRGVVAGRVGERLGGERLARLGRERAAAPRSAPRGPRRRTRGSSPRRRTRGSWRPRGSSSGRRCRCSRSRPRRRRRRARRCARTGRG